MVKGTGLAYSCVTVFEAIILSSSAHGDGPVLLVQVVSLFSKLAQLLEMSYLHENECHAAGLSTLAGVWNLGKWSHVANRTRSVCHTLPCPAMPCGASGENAASRRSGDTAKFPVDMQSN